jgi:O-methyltransferase involved in polyketide biosynthesis
MTEQTVGRTALGTATCRLIEQHQPQKTRLFDDPVVQDVVGAPIRMMVDFVAKNNAPWIFGLEPSAIPEFLKRFHLALLTDVGHADYQERYVKPVGRTLVVSEGERIVQAIVG